MLMVTSAGSDQVSCIECDRDYSLTFTSSSSPGELPPFAPRACFGRDELVENVVSLAQNHTPIALIGPGGIGKTSIALSALHDDRIKQQFGCDRRFIRCDQLTPSRIQLLSRLSEVIGSGIKNPQNLTALQPFLVSKPMIIIFDNGESILDPEGPESHEIYTILEELSWIRNICLCITSRISAVPLGCKCLEVPTLSVDAAQQTFYSIYDKDEQDDRVNGILEQLDFHPLSITLLATVAQRNKWGANRLTREWEKQRTAVLHTKQNGSLAVTIEFSLASPTFQQLGPSARELLGAVAFFPQGIDENNLEWLLPDVSNGASIFDKFCALSLTHRTGEFITMLAPLRDYLSPKDPNSSQLLRAIKQSYFTRLAVNLSPLSLEFKQAPWITSEDVNVEHLLDVFSTIDKMSGDVWDACGNFMKHLGMYKPRLVALGVRCEELPDDHRSKPECLIWHARLFAVFGNTVESKRLLTLTLKLWRERGNDRGVARALTSLCDINKAQGLYGEGVEQAREAVAIYQRLGDPVAAAHSLHSYTLVLAANDQPEAAKTTAREVTELHRILDNQFGVCRSLYILGKICLSKDEIGDAKKHFEEALEVASPSRWDDQLFLIHHALAWALFKQGNLDGAHVHIERAKSHAINDKHKLGHAMETRACFLHTQRRFEEAKSEALCSIDVFEKVGYTQGLKRCEGLLEKIKSAMNAQRSGDIDRVTIGIYFALATVCFGLSLMISWTGRHGI